jgi:hypothetical protein
VSCKKCEIEQDFKSPVYFRWKDTNIELRGCREHLAEVIDVLRAYTETPMLMVCRKKKDEGKYTGNDPLDIEPEEKEERME